jgi:hypothetical protein
MLPCCWATYSFTNRLRCAGKPSQMTVNQAADVLLEMFEKLDHLWRLDAAGEESKVEIPNGDARYGRKTASS